MVSEVSFRMPDQIAFELKRIVVVLITGLEMIIHAGVIWGWPSFVYILKQEAVFAHLCRRSVDDAIGSAGMESSEQNSSSCNMVLAATQVAVYAALEETTPNSSSSELRSSVTPPISSSPGGTGSGSSSYVTCDDQDAMIQLVFTLATGTQQICCFATGFKEEEGELGLFASYLMIASLLSYSSYVLFPAMIVVAGCGMTLNTVNVQVGNLFGPGKGTVISWLNGCVSVAVIVFYVMKVAYESGISPSTSFYFLAGSTILLLVNIILLPKDRIPWPLPPGYSFQSMDQSTGKGVVNGICPGEDAKPLRSDHDLKTIHCKNSSATTEKADLSSDPRKSCFYAVQELTEALKKQRYPNVRACIFSAFFWLFVFWFSVLQLNIFFLFGTFNPLLTRRSNGNDMQVSEYTNIFLLLQTSLLVLSHVMGLIWDRNKLGFCRKKAGTSGCRGPYDDLADACLPLALTTIMSIGYSALLLLPSLRIQILTFTLVLLVMAVLWGYANAYITVVFPMDIFASLNGIIRTISGLVTFLQFPLFRIIQVYFDDDPFYVIMGLIICDVLTFVLPIYTWYFVRKQRSTLSLSSENKSRTARV
ncbi:equilibrative nucleobase transporter 1-like [Diadema antillarum]|uniref:equilibrative nucleobase transporter 1-like n=1 Tax=Diadema antillarum TaxID=105358 RepID=UPI003A893D1C